MGGRRQSRWLRTADGFAVCGFSAALASLFSFVRFASSEGNQYKIIKIT
jgi:hypothetical protein